MLQVITRTAFFACFLLLAACAGNGNYAPVIERKERLTVVPAVYAVERGDTLFSIAWRYGLDFRGLAATNRISSPYTIYPGQQIRLKTAIKTSSRASDSKNNVQARSTVKAPPKASKTVRSKAPSTAKTWKKSTHPFRWRWPASGKTTRRYSSLSAVHKGIDIQGKLGEPVHAANSGKVVYAGSGLVGYGNLVIIKHDEHYLSAYGHNSKLLVGEGEEVKVGQKIAEFGDTGTDAVKLHFEIRRDGKPVNPLDLLPRGK